MSDRWACGIHFGSDEISAKSIFSHLPDGTGTFKRQFLKVPVPSGSCEKIGLSKGNVYQVRV